MVMPKGEFIDKRFWKPSPVLSGNLFFFGIVGGGKTWTMATIAQSYHSYGYKIFDMFGGKRNESGS